MLRPQDAQISQYCASIRGLIAPDVTAEHISNDYLLQRPFIPEAERKVRKRLSTAGIDADKLTGESLEDARLAAMHECAAVLCLTAPQLLRQTQIQIATEVQNIDWEKKRAFHLAEADELMVDIIEDADTPGRAASGRKRRNPFGAVGTERSEVGEPSYPTRRVPITYND